VERLRQGPQDGGPDPLTPKDVGWLLIAQKLESRRAVSLEKIIIFVLRCLLNLISLKSNVLFWNKKNSNMSF